MLPASDNVVYKVMHFILAQLAKDFSHSFV